MPRPGVEEAIVRQRRELFELEFSRTPPCSLGTGPMPPVSAENGRTHSREGIVSGTVATRELEFMLLNCVSHAMPIVGKHAELVGLMGWTPPPGFPKRDRKREALSAVDEGAAELPVSAEPSRLERRARAFGVGVYATGPTLTVESLRAERWCHAFELLETAAQAGSHGRTSF